MQFFCSKDTLYGAKYLEIINNGGVLMDTNIQISYQEKALELLKKDAEKIAQLIKVQMDNLTMPQCPLYEEVLRHSNVWFIT